MSSKPPLNRRMTRKLEYADLDALGEQPVAQSLAELLDAVDEVLRVFVRPNGRDENYPCIWKLKAAAKAVKRGGGA